MDGAIDTLGRQLWSQPAIAIVASEFTSLCGKLKCVGPPRFANHQLEHVTEDWAGLLRPIRYLATASSYILHQLQQAWHGWADGMKTGWLAPHRPKPGQCHAIVS